MVLPLSSTFRVVADAKAIGEAGVVRGQKQKALRALAVDKGDAIDVAGIGHQDIAHADGGKQFQLMLQIGGADVKGRLVAVAVTCVAGSVSDRANVPPVASTVISDGVTEAIRLPWSASR